LIEILIGLGVLFILKKLYSGDKSESIIFPPDPVRSIAQASGRDGDLVESRGDPVYLDPADRIAAEWEDEVAQWEAFDDADDGAER
jgi:hypothetical protein